MPPVQTQLPFTGTYTAIVTPFTKGGKLDESALEKIVKAQVKGGVDGIVPVGTTGESPTLDYEEHIAVIKRSVEFAAGKVKVLAAQRDTSVSAIVTEMLSQLVGTDPSYDDQWAAEVAVRAAGPDMRIGDITWSRDELHRR